MPTSAGNSSDKTLSACDECRTRKLKCSGEPAGCSRCKSEGIICHYSQRKTMGRPRKRRREEAGDTASIDGNIEASEDRAAGAADVEFQDSDFTTSSGSEPALGTDGFYMPNDSFERYGVAPLEIVDRPSLSNEQAFSLDHPGGPASDFGEGFPMWDTPQDLSQHFSIFANVPLQLQTPPIPPGELGNNNYIAENAVIGCSCLSNLYSMLAKFQSLPEPSFPYSMGVLRSAAALSRRVVVCNVCTQVYNTALQNSMLLGTLLQLLIMEYAKLLRHIDEKSKQAENMTFRLGDPSMLFDGRHTGLPDCPMAINVDLNGDEWRTLARKAVAQEVHGNQGTCGLIGLVQQMKDRQVSWRERVSKGQCTPFNSTNDHHSANLQHGAEHPDHLCVQVVYIENLRKSLEVLGL